MALLKSKFFNQKRYVVFILVLGLCLTILSCRENRSVADELDVQLTNIEEEMLLLEADSLTSLLSLLDTSSVSAVNAARIQTIEGLIQYNQEKYDKAIPLLTEAEEALSENREEFHLHLNQLIRAFGFEVMKLDFYAAKSYLECENYFAARKSKLFWFYSALGVLRMEKYLQIDRDELIKQISAERELLHLPRLDGLYYAALGYASSQMKADSLAAVYYEQSVYTYTEAKEWKRAFNNELNVISCLSQEEFLVEGERYLTNLLHKYDSYALTPTQLLRHNILLGRVLGLNGREEEAIELFEKNYIKAKQLKEYIPELDCTGMLAYLYQKTGDYEAALKMKDRVHSLERRKANQMQKVQLLALGAYYKYDKLANDKLKLKVRIQRAILIIILIGALVLLLMVVGWWIAQKNRQKRKKLLTENRTIRKQIDELVSSFQKATHKNEQLINQMQDIRTRHNESIRIENLLAMIERKEIKNWMEFELQFTLLLPDWINNLKEAAPVLTPTDLKYCMCLYFNMNNYEIAKLCDISVDTIKSAKKRIRDKLALNESTEIYLYLKNVG